MASDVKTVVDRYVAEQQVDLLAVLQVLSDERLLGPDGTMTIDALSAEFRAHYPDSDWTTAQHELDDAGVLEVSGATIAPAADLAGPLRAALDRHQARRAIEWRDLQLREGEILRAFGEYCRDELDDVSLLEMDLADDPALAVRLCLEGYRETTDMELRAGFLFVPLLATERIVLLGSLEGAKQPLVNALIENPALRARLTLLDLERLEKVSCAQNALFVHLEWFLREAYGVKVLPNPELSQALVSAGIISMGMG